MRLYTVHAPAEIPVEPERFAFVKDGFSWPALFVPIVWILWHRLWVTLVWYIVFLLVVAWVDRLAGDTPAVILGLLGGLFFAFEANDIRRRSFAARGWDDLGSASGSDRAEAEARFFERWGAQHPPPVPRPPWSPPASTWQTQSATPPASQQQTVIRPGAYPAREPQEGDPPVLGLFPEPER
jgi:hypothetical protein